MINFVSNLPRDLRTGGFSAMNVAARAALERSHDVAYVGPIDPPVVSWRKALSKALRLSGMGGDFAAFSEPRLSAMAAEVARRADPGAELDFFHGFTPWILTRPPRRYIAWGDCAFRDYMDVFHDRTRFSAGDLGRIEAAEAAWLKGAARVLFTSEWAAGRALNAYGLSPERVGSVGIFGELDGAPERDAYAGEPRFAFISTNFVAKGGPIVMDAFRLVRRAHPAATLTIVGAAPPQPVAGDGVEYAGFLRKEVADEHRRFREILARAAAVVHPTRSDVAPLMLIEAAMFGCPAIASRAFAIPEIVEDGVSGFLIDTPADPVALAAAMRRVIEHPAEQAAMRRAARRRAREQHSKDRFEERLLAQVGAALAERKAAAA